MSTAGFDRQGSLIRQLQGALKGRAINAGLDTGVVFAASTSSAARTVTHGLGRTPVAVIATSGTSPGSGVTISTDSFTSTTFNAVGFFPSAVSGTFPFSWIAIG